MKHFIKIILLFIILIGILKNPSNEYSNEYFNDIIKLEDKYIDKEDTIQIYKSLGYIDKIFNKNNIKYSLDGGTLLGAIRHNGLIPWDDDADICIEDKDLYKFLSLKEQFRKDGYGLSKISLCYKIFPLNGKPIKNRIYKWCYC